jgi:hypothetical protein
MMGTNVRAWAPLPPVSLEDVIPPDHVSRHLELVADGGHDRSFIAPDLGHGGELAAPAGMSVVGLSPVDRPSVPGAPP